MSEFHRVLLGIHAEARRVDRDQALLGALGVGAFAYPHQIDSVHRMLTGATCRWLLADEVGLGKTIQAIMVMRALAAQSPKPLATALVIPDDLVAQWEEELLCRGHTVAPESGEDSVIVGNLVIRLVRPSRLLNGSKIAATKIDFLIIDEFTKLQVQIRRDLIAASRVIPNVLVITATPALHNVATRAELLALLEPEAARIAQAEGRDILPVLLERENQALERFKEGMQEAGKRKSIEETYGLFRRLIRTSRVDYPDVLPKRIYQPIRLSPTDGDVERARTTRAYVTATAGGNLEIKREALLQVAGRSPPSLRNRISTLKRTTPDLQTAWREIDRCLRDELGDAKLDALIDHLRTLHAKKPDARAVIVAEDNPTTDYLRDAIEKLTDVKVAKKRRSVSVSDDLEEHVTSLKEALDDFISGEAKVLVAADAAKEGHNLQFADEIIFFALPWSPPDIQQWIGRIDRLGTKGLPANRRITITPLVVENSIENNILGVLEVTGVFLRSEVFDESEWADISDAISAVANGLAGASWLEATKQAKMLGDAYEEWLQVTRLPPSPRSVQALKCETRFRERPYSATLTTFEGSSWNWHLFREHACDLMIKIACEDYLEVRKGQDDGQRFKTMWYKTKPSENDLIIPDLDATSSGFRQAFITRRDAIECPPRPFIEQNDNRKRRLHFFDHGNSLHDGVIAAFSRQTPVTGLAHEFIVEYPPEHPILQWKDCRLLLAVAELELRNALTIDINDILGTVDPLRSKAEQDAHTFATRTALDQFQADRRWLTDLAPDELLFVSLVEVGSEVEEVDAVAAILDPFHEGRCARQMGKHWSSLSETRRKEARGTALALLGKLGGEKLARAKLAVNHAIESRCFSAQAEAENLVAAARAEVKVAVALDSKFEFNRAAQRGASLTLALAESTANARNLRLKSAEIALSAVAAVKKPKMFWLIPRASEEIP